MRKSHSIDTSYLYEEAQSTFTEAVNPKINANQNADRNNGGATNLCKSKSEYNLAFASPNRSGEIKFSRRIFWYHIPIVHLLFCFPNKQ